MVNIIFDKVDQGKSLLLIANKNQITWNLLFDFLEKKTNVSRYKTKLCINNKFYTCKEKISFVHKNFFSDRDDFIVIYAHFRS